MPSCFPGPIIKCIRDAVQPTADDLSLVQQRVWHEGVMHLPSRGDDVAHRFAHAALSGANKAHLHDGDRLARQGH